MSSIMKKTKLTMLIGMALVGAVAVTTAAVLLIVRFELLRRGQDDAVEQQQQSLRTAATVLESALPGMSVEWGADGQITRVVMDKPIPAFTDHKLIDEI